MTTPWTTERYLLVQTITGERHAMSQRRRSPLPWILLGGAVWVVAGVIVLVVVLSGGSDPGSGPRDVAAKAAAAVSDNDADGLRAIACEADDDDYLGLLGRGHVESAKAGAVVDEDDEDVLIRIEIAYDDGSTRSPKVEIERESGNWCLDDVEYS
jgi:hypothetical protein